MVKLIKSFNSVFAIKFIGSLILDIFKYFNGTLINKFSKLSTFSKLKDDISRYFNLVHSEKRLLKLLINEVLKLDKSIDSNELQLKNMWSITFKEGVLKLDKSIVFSELQSLNIFFIDVTKEKSKFDKSINSSELHPSNIDSISFTNDEVKYEKSIDFSALHP